MEITQANEVKALITKLNNVNQLMKTMRYDSSYTIYNGLGFASPNGVNKPNVKGGFDKVDIGRTYCELNIDLGILNEYVLYISDGKKLYQFIQEHKKNIDRIAIEYSNDGNSIPYLGIFANGTVFLINIVGKNDDINMHESMIGILQSETAYPRVDGRYTLSYNDILLISKEKTIPLVLQFDDYKVRTTRKMLIGMTTSDEIELTVYQTNLPQYFFGIFAIFRKEMTIYHVYKLVKY